MKVVINTCYGGFDLSDEGMIRYGELKGLTVYPVKESFITSYYIVSPEERVEDIGDAFYKLSVEERRAYNQKRNEQTIYAGDFKRDDPALVQAVEELGDEANGQFAILKVVEIPDDAEYTIDEYDGMEHVAEVHRTWS